MKHILPAFIIILLFVASCKKKEESTTGNCNDNVFPVEKGTAPTAKITDIAKNGKDVTITFQGKITTIYFDRLRPSGNVRYVYEVQYDKLCQESVLGQTSYEFKRTGQFTYTFKHSILNDDETNAFEIDDWSMYNGPALDRVTY